MRSYDVTAAALALGVPAKWIDNVLSHHRVAGVVQSRQGVRRRLGPDAVLVLAVALELVDGLHLPLARALAVSAESVASRGPVHAGAHVSLGVDLRRVERDVTERLAAAAEAAPVRPRGRPRVRRHD